MTHDRAASLAPEYFETIYGRDPDPWRFATSDYEAAKYRATLAALPRRRYRRGFEVGCSIGVLTKGLAARCDRLLAVDVVAAALAAAEERCRDLPQASFRQLEVPAELPDGTFDLIVLSEVAYYWSGAALDRMIAWSARRLETDGHLVLVHWTGETDYPMTGDAVHDRYGAATGFAMLLDRTEPCYRLSVLAPLGNRSESAAHASGSGSSRMPSP